MKTIEIVTAHNIVVTQELASVGQRIGAFIVDAIILLFYIIVVSMLSQGNVTVRYLGIGLVSIFYHLIWEIFNHGQSPGKKLMNIRVVSIRGISPSIQDLLQRWAFRLVDITFTFGTLAILSIVTSINNQRIGDLLGETTVINLRARRRIDLQSLHQLKNQPEEIAYPAIVRYSDTDMLLVKETLQRYQKEKNAANSQMIGDLVNRIGNDLRLDIRNVDHISFLKKVLSDYIMLTR